MKKLMVLLLAGCLVVISQGFSKAAADEDLLDSLFGAGGEIPLSALAGIYAMVPGHGLAGSIVVCVENMPPTFPPAKCGSPNAIVVPLTTISVGVETFDDKGNACGTMTGTTSVLPLDASPPSVGVSHI